MSEHPSFCSVWLKRVYGLPRRILQKYFIIINVIDDNEFNPRQYFTRFFTSPKPELNVRFLVPITSQTKFIRFELSRMHKAAKFRRKLQSPHLVLAKGSINLSSEEIPVLDCENDSIEYFEFHHSEDVYLYPVEKEIPFSEDVEKGDSQVESEIKLSIAVKKLHHVPHYLSNLNQSQFNGTQQIWKTVSNQTGKLFQRGTLDLIFQIQKPETTLKYLKIIAQTDTQYLSIPYSNRLEQKIRESFGNIYGFQNSKTLPHFPRLTFTLFQNQIPSSVKITLQFSSKLKETKKYRFYLNFVDINQLSNKNPQISGYEVFGESKNLNSEGDFEIPNFFFAVSHKFSLWGESYLQTNHWGTNGQLLTNDFNEEYQYANRDTFKERFYEQVSKDLTDNLCVLFVRGLLCNYYATYFVENLKRMQDLGLYHKEVAIDTSKGCITNAKSIATFIQNELEQFQKLGKQIKFIIFAHSKGVADVHAAISLFSDISSHIYGILAMQGVHYGTPSFDVFQVGKFQGAVEKLFQGEREALLDLSYPIRSTFAENNPFPSHIPTISLATVFQAKNGPDLDSVIFDRAYTVAAKHIRRQTGFESDGLVIQADARIPFSDIILLEDMTHSHVASFFPGAKYSPGPITQACISLLIRKVEGSQRTACSGKINLIIESGTELAPKDITGTSDPFVVVFRDKFKICQTPVIKKTLNPVWNFNSVIRYGNLDNVIEFDCWDEDRFSNDFEGCVTVTVRELLADLLDGDENFVKKSFDLQRSESIKTGVISGQLNFLIRYSTNPNNNY